MLDFLLAIKKTEHLKYESEAWWQASEHVWNAWLALTPAEINTLYTNGEHATLWWLETCYWWQESEWTEVNN